MLVCCVFVQCALLVVCMSTCVYNVCAGVSKYVKLAGVFLVLFAIIFHVLVVRDAEIVKICKAEHKKAHSCTNNNAHTTSKQKHTNKQAYKADKHIRTRAQRRKLNLHTNSTHAPSLHNTSTHTQVHKAHNQACKHKNAKKADRKVSSTQIHIIHKHQAHKLSIQLMSR